MTELDERLDSLAIDIKTNKPIPLEAKICRGLALARMLLEKHGWIFESYEYGEDFIQGNSSGQSWYGRQSEDGFTIDCKTVTPSKVVSVEGALVVEVLAKYVKDRYALMFWRPRDPKTGRVPFLPINEGSTQVERDVVRGVVAVLLQCGVKFQKPKELAPQAASDLLLEFGPLYISG